MIKQQDSAITRWFRMLGLGHLAWSLRRLYCPVKKEALVLEVGSGGNPYPRANVLLDAYEDTIERYHIPLVKDRPLVFGVVERMPFRDKAFDFVIASHVLEHSVDPVNFLRELMRVSKAGYIETPDAFCERLIPFRFHRLEVTNEQGKIRIWKKPSWRPHGELVDLFEKKVKGKKFIQLMQKHPEPFYMRYYWEDSIAYEVANPDVDASWPLPSHIAVPQQTRSRFRDVLVRAARWTFSQAGRNKKIDVWSLLKCVKCDSTNFSRTEISLSCRECGKHYAVRDGIPVMFPDM